MKPLLHDSEACEFCRSGQWFRCPSDAYPDAHVAAPADVEWVRFTKRTEDPKLLWLEHALYRHGIPSRRDGSSFHAPILMVPKDRLDAAWEVLRPIDDVPDDDPMFEDWRNA